MAKGLKENATHLTKFRGAIKRGTTNALPTNRGVAGLKAGDMYVNTDTSIFLIYNGTTWYGRKMA